jgi:hypothetical protein
LLDDWLGLEADILTQTPWKNEKSWLLVEKEKEKVEERKVLAKG